MYFSQVANAIHKCIRLNKQCDYPERGASEVVSAAPSAGADLEALLARVQRLEGALPIPPESSGSTGTGSVAHTPGLTEQPRRPSFPAAFFLDRDFFQPLLGDALSSTTAPQLTECRTLLGPSVEALRDEYEATAGRWLPIMNPRRLAHDVQTALPDQPALALLLLSMRLLSREELHGLCPEYKLAKSLSSALENEGVVSLRFVQALVLLAAYELGHCLYPSTYLTIGRAARLGMLMGLHDKRGPQLFLPGDTFSAQEEERRFWWALLILDRYLSVVNAL